MGRCDSKGSCMMGDKLFLRADAAGSTMMGDNLAAKDNFKMNVGVPGMGSFGIQTADNFLRADAGGNVMMGDSLKAHTWRKFKHTMGKTASVAKPVVETAATVAPLIMADNYLRCDASGSCMMGDNLATKDNNFAHVMYIEEDVYHPITIVNAVGQKATTVA